MNTDRVSFGAWVRALRRQHDLTQDELGSRVGCTGAYIRKIEADERHPSSDIAERLATCLGISQEQLNLFLRSSRGDDSDLWLNPAEPARLAFSPDRYKVEPLAVTGIIGREDVLGELHQRLLRPSVQLLTLTGPPGVGKTRLAQALSHKVQEGFANGVCWVSLASVQQPELLLTTIAQSLDSAFTLSQELLPALIGYLRSRHILVVLDSMEQLVSAASILSDLLRAAPKLKFLVTSQLALQLTAEHEFSVAPLLIPQAIADIHSLMQVPAVQLFVQRAQAANPSFKLTPSSAVSVAELCRRLDGLPLALELAAARCKIFSPQALLERLDQRLTLLHREVRDQDSRHHSLRAAIDWSYSLLSPQDQILFCQLSVFSAPCTLSAIEAICSVDNDHNHPLVDRLTALVDHSLLQRIQDVDDEPRVTMLESVRVYAATRLNEQDIQQTLRRAHAEYYLHLMLSDVPHWGQDRPEWLKRIDANYPHLRAALSWSYGQTEYSLAATIAAAITPYWVACGLSGVGRAWVERLLSIEHADEELRAELLAAAGELAFHQSDYGQSLAWYSASLELNRRAGKYDQCAQVLYRLAWIALRQADYSRAKEHFQEAFQLGQMHGYQLAIASGLSGLGWIAREQGDYQHAQELHERSLDHYRIAGEVSSVAYALNTLGWMTRERGNYARAQRLHEESLQLYRELQHLQGMAHALNNLGWVAGMQEDYDRARALLEESLALRQQIADRRAIAWSFSDLGWVMREQGDYTQSRTFYEEALAIYHELGDRRGIAGIRLSLGLIAVAQQEYPQAQQFFRQSSTSCADLRDWRGMARCLEGMALLALTQHQLEHSARLLGITEGLRARIRATVPSQERRWYDRMVAAIMAEGLAAETWREEGRALSLTEALADILPSYVRVTELPPVVYTSETQSSAAG